MTGSRLTSSTGYVIADIAGNLLKSTLLSMDDGHRVTVGGNVLSSLDKGVILYQGKEAGTVDASLTTLPTPPDPTVCPAADVNLAPEGSIARRWNEHQLNSIRRDIPRPGVHARNLFHTSVAMYDAWAAFEADAQGYFGLPVSIPNNPSVIGAYAFQSLAGTQFRLFLTNAVALTVTP
jgi:hypothetical protein